VTLEIRVLAVTLGLAAACLAQFEDRVHLIVQSGQSAINAVALSPDGKLAITPGADAATMVWDVSTEKILKAEWKVTENGRLAKFYSLTRPGRRALERESANWERLAGAIFHVVRLDEV
jgi:WD40 repeat protein